MKITIDTHNCSREELSELKEYLENESWNFKTDEVEDKPKFILRDSGINVVGSHFVSLNEKIRDEEMLEYHIADREELINDLMRWISECNKDSGLMREDMEMLMQLKDDYIFSSNSTNSYISSIDSGFNETCEELIELSESL